jgi:hypothetical protein
MSGASGETDYCPVSSPDRCVRRSGTSGSPDFDNHFA